jgi:PAS domain S-box-containing protein
VNDVANHFMPHGMCYLWNPQMLLLQIASDAGIALAYFSIPVMLLYFLRTRGDIPLRGTIAMFGGFIIACGLTHVMGIWTIWHPAYWLDGGLKAFTAAISLVTAAMMLKLIPRALTLKTPIQLERLNQELREDARLRREAFEESEHRYQSLAETISLMVWTADAAGNADYFNQRWFDYTGMTLEESCGSRWVRVIHRDDLRRYLDRWKSSLAHGTQYEIEYRVKRASDGAYRWHLGRVLPVPDAAGNVTKWIGTATDIDDLKIALEAANRFAESVKLNEELAKDIVARKVIEQELRSAERLALAANEAKSRFLATMSHEIRTPMNGIIGMTEMLTLSALDDDQKQCVKVVRDSGQSLLRVLDDILDYSKIGAGKLDIERVDFSLPHQVASIVSLLEPQFVAKGVTLEVELSPDIPASLKGDPGRLRQIIVNLLANALKFTPPQGSVRLEAVGEPADETMLPVRFTVSDTGVGIAPDARHRLFQPFSQVDGSTTRKYGGTGLGLSICKQLVNLMGGHIGVVSTGGAGASFWFTVPFLASDRVAVPLDDGTEREMLDRYVHPARPEKLLVAEDNDVNTLLAIRQFKRLGFDVTIAPTGRQAVEACRRQSFDLIFMDCHMPEMDGFEATGLIRKIGRSAGRQVPIVAMTANAQAEDRDACIAAGMDDYISKPVSMAALRAVVERWLPAPPK